MSPQKTYLGTGSLSHLKDILLEIKPFRIFLVGGKSSYEKSGAKAKIEPLLEGFDVTRFFDTEENPTLETVNKGIALFKGEKHDAVIAIGGGSVLDTAKAICSFSAQRGDPADYLLRRLVFEGKSTPLIAIPTTAGSGSEATRYAVINIGKKKHSLSDHSLIPDYCIVDPHLTYSLPKKVAASCGMDALSQAIESYWSIHSTEESKGYAKEAITLLCGNLADAIVNGSHEAKDKVMRASYLAGCAINITMTTACHAISYPITSFFGVPHGHAVALTLGEMLEYNSSLTEEDCLDKRGAGHAKSALGEIISLLGVSSPSDAHSTIKKIMEEIGLETSLSALGIRSEQDIQTIVENGFSPERMNNNPRKMTKEVLIAMLTRLG